MRERIEDLGRLSEMITQLLDHPLFDKCNLPQRCKDYGYWWKEKKEDEKDDTLRSLVYGIDEVKEKILQILLIANGQDELNVSENI